MTTRVCVSFSCVVALLPLVFCLAFFISHRLAGSPSLLYSIEVNEKLFVSNFTQHKCHKTIWDISTRGSSSAEQLKNEGEGANKY